MTVPALDVALTAYAPTLDGVVLPAPTGYTRTPEDVYAVVTLASGLERRYVRGTRYTYALEWSRLRGPDLDALRAAATLGDVGFLTLDGELVTVYVTEPPEEEPVAGTNPVRYSTSITLREPALRSPFGA